MALVSSLFVIALGQSNIQVGRHSPLPNVDHLRYAGVRQEIGLSKHVESRVVQGFRAIQALEDEGIRRHAAFLAIPHDRRKDLLEQKHLEQEERRTKRQTLEGQIFALVIPTQKGRLKQLAIQISYPIICLHPDIRGRLDISLSQEKRMREVQARWMKESDRLGKQVTRDEYFRRAQEPRKAFVKAIETILTARQLGDLKAMAGKPVNWLKLVSNRIPVSTLRP